MFSAAQITDMRRKLGVSADADGATIVAALAEALDERADPPAPAVPVLRSPQTAMPERQSDVVAWGLATGRYSPARAQVWARAAADERRRTGAATQTAATIRSLHRSMSHRRPRLVVADGGEGPCDGHHVRAHRATRRGRRVPAHPRDGPRSLRAVTRRASPRRRHRHRGRVRRPR